MDGIGWVELEPLALNEQMLRGISNNVEGGVRDCGWHDVVGEMFGVGAESGMGVVEALVDWKKSWIEVCAVMMTVSHACKPLQDLIGQQVFLIF